MGRRSVCGAGKRSVAAPKVGVLSLLVFLLVAVLSVLRRAYRFYGLLFDMCDCLFLGQCVVVMLHLFPFAILMLYGCASWPR